jgi:hypothetical protein
MKKIGLLLLGLIAGIFLTVSFLSSGSLGSAAAEAPGLNRAAAITATATANRSDEGVMAVTPTYAPGDDELAPANLQMDVVSPNALPTQIPGETLVYFTTTDSDATGTVIFLLNTDSIAHTVALRGYSYNGVLGYSLNIAVPATSLVRLSSDSIAAAPPPSWSTPAPIITNFTDFTYFASLSLPKGVKAEGYVLFNGGTGTVDPRADQGAIPLRFSTDPATLFLPAALNAP